MAKLKGGTRIYGLATVDDDLYVGGDIIVTGNVNLTASFNTPFLVVSGQTPNIDDDTDRGILFNWHNGLSQKLGFFGFDDSTGKLTYIPDATRTFDVISGITGTIDAKLEWSNVLNKPDPTIAVNLTGSVTGSGSATLTDLGNGTVAIATSISNVPFSSISGRPSPNVSVTLQGAITGSGSATLTDLTSNGAITISTTLANNSITLGTNTVGNYIATISGTSNQVIVSGSGSETAAVTLSLPQSIAATSTPTFAALTLTNGGIFSNVSVGSAASNEISTSVGNLVLDSATGTTVIDDNLIVNGTFTVQGNTIFTNTTFDNATLTVGLPQTSDNNFDRGIVFNWHNGTNPRQGFFGFDDSTGSFIYIPDAEFDAGTYVGVKGTIDAYVNWNNITAKPDPIVGVTLTGDVTGSGSVTLTDLASGNISLATTIQPNSVALGTDTTGNYVANITAGSGISITDSGSEGAIPTISHSNTSSVNNVSVDNSNTVVIQDISFTFDTFGHVTAASVSSVDLSNSFFSPSGGSLTGFLTLHADPTSALHAATKQYVDGVAQGLAAKPAVRAATTTNLAATYTNGTFGVGALLTSTTNGALPNIDNVGSWQQYQGILVKNQTNKAENGRYFVLDLGSPTTPWVLKRCGYCDEASEIPSAYVFVQEGTLYAGTGWVAVVDDFAAFDVGIDNINWFQFSGAGSYVAGSGLVLTDNIFSHADTSSVTSLSANGRQYITGLTFDTFGHVTGYSTGTETVVDTTYSLSAIGTSNPAIRLSSSTGVNNDITFAAGTNVTLSRVSNTITINANDADVVLGTDTTGNYVASLALGTSQAPTDFTGLTFNQTNTGTEGASFTIAHADTSNVGNVPVSEGKVITGIEFDGFGHVTNISATAINLANPTFDNIRITGNTISSVLTNTNIILEPNGSGLVTIPSAMGIKLGNPTLGSLTSNAVTLTDQSVVTNSIAQLNQVLGKLVPAAPPTFPGNQGISINSVSTYRMTNFTQTDRTGGNDKQVGPGTTVTTVRRTNTYTTSTITNVGPGDSGTVSVYKNSVASGSRTLTTGSDNGTYNNLVIANNVDYGTITSTALGFWESFNCYATGTVGSGWNEVYINHTLGSSTNNAIWYYDDSNPGTPTFSNVTITPDAATTDILYSSTVPHYTSNTLFNLNFNVNRLSGEMYPTSDVFVVGTAGGAFQQPLGVTYSQAGVPNPMPQNLYVSSGSQAVSTTAQIITGFGSSSTGPSISVSNSYATGSQVFSTGSTVLYKTGTSSTMEETNIVIGSSIGAGTGLAFRINNQGSTDTPVYTASASAFLSDAGPLNTYDATVVAGVLKHDQTNYASGYLPVGPNLSVGRSGAQYFTFKFIRTSVSKFDIKFTGTLAGLWIALPGSVIDTSSGLNGWIDMTIPYAGAGVPGSAAGGNGSNGCALGGVITVNSAVTNHRKTCTFGTVSSSSTATNEIYVRIKLTGGQTITALSLETASN